jgi:2',3'-cyclic-nucleotide 2'-phosphodiesterase (5'-nucleotidase family)
MEQVVAEITVGGAPLDTNKLYTVATNSYMLAGGDGYSALGGGRVLINADDGNRDANDVINYVEKIGVVMVGVEGRIKTVGQ